MIQPSLSRNRGVVLLAQPVVAFLFQMQSQFWAAGLDDTPFHHDVDEVRLDLIEDPLVVCDHQDPQIRTTQRIDAFGHNS